MDVRLCTPLCRGLPCADGEGPPDEGKNCDMPPFGIGSGPGDVSRGEAHLNAKYPKMSKFHSCRVAWRGGEHERQAAGGTGR